MNEEVVSVFHHLHREDSGNDFVEWVSTIDVGGLAPNSHLWVSILVVLFNKLKKCTL